MISNSGATWNLALRFPATPPLSTTKTMVYKVSDPLIYKFEPVFGYRCSPFAYRYLPTGITSANPSPDTATVVVEDKKKG